MKKVILVFDFLNGPIYKDVYDAKNNALITGIDELDNNEKIMSLNQEMQDIYSSFYDQNKLSDDDLFNHKKLKGNIKRLYQMKIQLIDEIKAVLPNIVIDDRTIEFFDMYLQNSERDIKELDVVKLIKEFKGLKIGTIGTIVHVYNKHNFEVEFVDENEETIDVFTIDDSYLECIWKFDN